MNKENYKKKLKEMIDEDPYLKYGKPGEEIYVIDDLVVYGSFTYGRRGEDHFILRFDDVSWEDVLNWGTVIAPETKTYISDTEIEYFENMGYSRLPLNRNHIVGYFNKAD